MGKCTVRGLKRWTTLVLSVGTKGISLIMVYFPRECIYVWAMLSKMTICINEFDAILVV